MKGLIVYLAGPMAGLTVEQVRGWRVEVGEKLKKAGFVVLDPTRGLTIFQPDYVLKEACELVHTESPHVVFERDKFDATRADILLVNLFDAKQASVGTIMEIAWAHLTGKFVCTIAGPGSSHNHAFITEASSIMFESVSEACVYLIETFGG